MNKPFDKIIENIPVAFFKDLEEALVTALFEANQLTKMRYDTPEQVSMLGQNRHALCERAFRQVAANYGMTVHASETQPRGGKYSWVDTGNLYFLRSNIQTHTGTPRPTKFRKAWAEFNEWLSPLQFDLLKPTPEPNSDNICGMIVISCYPPARARPSEAAFIGIGIPNVTLSRWHALTSISELVAMYHDKESELAPKEAAVIIKDVAIPRLKKHIKSDQS